jgi:Na+/serine symporter
MVQPSRIYLVFVALFRESFTVQVVVRYVYPEVLQCPQNSLVLVRKTRSSLSANDPVFLVR